MNYLPDDRGALSKDELIDIIQATLEDCRATATSGADLPPVAKASFGGADTAQLLGYHTGAAHNHVVDAMTKLAVGFAAFDQSVGHFRKDVRDTDETNSIPFLKGRTSVETLNLGQGCATGDSPTDFNTNNQCVVPTEGG